MGALCLDGRGWKKLKGLFSVGQLLQYSPTLVKWQITAVQLSVKVIGRKTGLYLSESKEELSQENGA